MGKPRLSRLAAALLLAAAAAQAAGGDVKPGWNLLSRHHDVEIGREAATQLEKHVQVLRDSPELQNYVSQLGTRLARLSTATDFPYSFHLVGDNNINAFALPGGPIYLHTGAITAADNEAQLAGVMAHEISHIALRHSTSQASKAFAVQIPLILASFALGSSDSLLARLTEIGLGFGVNSAFLKYSRDAERDADILGARLMAQAGFHPVEMARYFEKLKAQERGAAPIQFFSDHPNPGNRVKYVEEEVRDLPRRDYTTGSPNFSRIRELAAQVPLRRLRRGSETRPDLAPDPPSAQFREYHGGGFRLSYPSNWQPHQEPGVQDVILAPRQGLLRDRGGRTQVGAGAIAAFFATETRSLTRATDELIAYLQSRDRQLSPLRGQRRSVVVDGSNGETVLLVGLSPYGNQREFDSLLAVTRPEGLFYLVLVAPESDYNNLRPTFQRIQSSVRFR